MSDERQLLRVENTTGKNTRRRPGSLYNMHMAGATGGGVDLMTARAGATGEELISLYTGVRYVTGWCNCAWNFLILSSLVPSDNFCSASIIVVYVRGQPTFTKDRSQNMNLKLIFMICH